MKRNLLLTLSFCITALFSFAQLAPGSDFSGNITGIDVNSDEAVDVQAWLDEGKVVVIDLFATWCPPCWEYHTSGYLEEMSEKYGPNGTDQIRVLGIEADDDTPESLLFAEMQGTTRGTVSLGNWTVNPSTGLPINYNLIQNTSALNNLPISGWPTFYIIHPNGRLFSVDFGRRYEEEYWLNAIGVTNNPDIEMSGDLGLSDFCFDLTTDEVSFEIFNPTHLEITEMTLDVSVNGTVVNTVQYDGTPIAAFEATTITVPEITLTDASTVEVVANSINGIDGSFAEVGGNAGKYEVATETMTIVFTTDLYAVETSWSVSDDMGNELLAVGPYEAGPLPYGGGGADANTSHEYELEITGDVSCLTFTINDSFGDGLGSWFNGNTGEIYNIDGVPGLEIFDQWGNAVKDNDFTRNAAGQITGVTGEGFNFGNSTDVLVNAEMTTGVEAITELEGSKIYPNPVAETLNVELNFSEVTDYNIAIVDIYGKVVRSLGSYSNTQLSTNYNVEDLASGMYMITIQSDKGQNVMKFTKS